MSDARYDERTQRMYEVVPRLGGFGINWTSLDGGATGVIGGIFLNEKTASATLDWFLSTQGIAYKGKLP